MPSKEGYKDRWLCFGCGMRGRRCRPDEALLPRRGLAVGGPEHAGWSGGRTGGRQCESGATPTPASGPTYFSPGTGRRTDLDAGREAEERRLDQSAENAWDDLTDFDRRELIRLKDKVGDVGVA